VVHNMGDNGSSGVKSIASADVLQREFEYVMTAIDKVESQLSFCPFSCCNSDVKYLSLRSTHQVKSNESSWNYLRGLWNKYKNFDMPSSASEGVIPFTTILEKRYWLHYPNFNYTK
jgi:hypothetical protein